MPKSEANKEENLVPGVGCAVRGVERYANPRDDPNSPEDSLNKCDRGRPSCSQCRKIGRECPGYQDPNALRFYDQSDEVVAKAQARHKSRQKSKETTLLTQLGPLSLQNISEYPEEWATSYTVAFYIGTAENRGILPFVLDLIGKAHSPALEATVKAIGLASISKIHQLPRLKYAAALEYGKALLATNAALCDPILAKSDSTLTAVIMLGMYEVITGSGSNMMEGWLNHVEGSMKLLESRGTGQLGSKRGLELFTLVRMQITISNIFYKRRISPAVAALSEIAWSRRNDQNKALEEFLKILIQLGDLSADIQEIFKHANHRTTEDPDPFIKKALHLDADLVSWSMSLSHVWHYNAITTPVHLRSKSDTYSYYYGDTYHTFNSIGFASGWNNYCQTRIIIQEIIRSLYMRTMGSVTADIFQKTMDLNKTICRQMIGGICASVPYHFNSGEVGVGLAFRLLWPLFIAANCAATTPEIRDWAMKTLDFIGNTTGIQQALIMSNSVKQGHTMNLIPGT